MRRDVANHAKRWEIHVAKIGGWEDFTKNGSTCPWIEYLDKRWNELRKTFEVVEDRKLPFS
jgi:hypothetical protein